MNIENKTILITGANRGIGRALVNEALEVTSVSPLELDIAPDDEEEDDEEDEEEEEDALEDEDELEDEEEEEDESLDE